MDKKPIKLVAVLERVSTSRDGGTKITLVCGADSLSAIQELQTLNAEADVCLALAIVPFEKDCFDD